ncbi:MAG: sigma-70 family RNA polymerase sigma factor [Planctomycetota bacterium]
MHDLPQTRQSLLLALGQRSDDAWTEFLEVYENALFRYCRSKGLQDADARDVTQEVLSAVHKRIPSWDLDESRGSFRAWLFRVARNISVDEIQRRSKSAIASGDTQVAEMLSQVPEVPEGSQVEFDEEYRRSLLDWASRQVKSDFRETTWRCFRMTAIEGMSAEQVASALNVPIGSVYTAKCRVVARIRSKIRELEEFSS